MFEIRGMELKKR